MRALILLLVLGCRPSTPTVETRPFVDSRGKTVQVPVPPKRIVSILPSATEFLFAVGAGGQVVGVTTYCDYPPEAKDKPKIGDIVVDFEKIAAIRPDLIVTTLGMTKQATADLEAKGYAVFSIDPEDFEGIAQTLRLLGQVTGHADEGARAADELLARVKDLERKDGPTVYFESSGNPIYTAGTRSYAGDAIRRAGGRNIFEGGWKAIEWESVLAKKPEVILIAHDQRAGLENRAGWKTLRARVHFVDKTHFVYPTPRLVLGLEDAARILHEK